MFKKILIGFLALFVFYTLIGFLIPSDWTVTRSVVIKAPTTKIYPLVANIKNGWPKWSTFDKNDPTLSYTHSGPETGVGATRKWTSKKMGEGSQTVTAADVGKGVDFEWMLNNKWKLIGRFKFEPAESGATKVTWTDWGDTGWNPYFRYFTLVMDKMLGKQFEDSLAELKKQAEI